MKKRIIPLFFLVLLLATVMIPTSAAISTKAISGKPTLKIEGTTAYCVGKYNSGNRNDAISITVTLMQGSKEIASWSASGKGSVTISKTCKVETKKTYLKKKGFTKNAICGILGNMNSESTINPAVWQSLNDMYLGYGLVQWDDGKLFIDWAKKEGVISAATAEAVNSLAYSNPKKLMDAELDYLIVSMNTVGNWFKPDNNQSKYGTSETLTASQFKVSNKSADILARIFCGHYERPGVPKISERVANAKKWYNFL